MTARSLWHWAAREAFARPLDAFLLGLALASLVALSSIALLLGQGLENTTQQLLAEGPALVVRRVGPAGWLPMPESALTQLRAVRGVTRATARVWGTVRWKERSLTALGSPEIARHEAQLGPGLELEPGSEFEIEGMHKRRFKLARRMSSGLVAQDLLLLAVDDAREVLGLPTGTASDLALWVFHEGEAQALVPELRSALPFPIVVRTRAESLAEMHAELAQRTGLRSLVLLPALLAMALLLLASVRSQSSGRREIAILKALGWDSGEIVRLHLLRAASIALPALALGWALAYFLVFVSGAPWVGRLFFAWTTSSPQLSLDPAGVLLPLCEVAGLVLGPWLAVTLLPALRSAAVDPELCLRGEEG